MSSLTYTSVSANPLGWERYSLTGLKSDVFRDKSPEHLYEQHALQLVLAGPAFGATDKRLIDIEAHTIGKQGQQKLRLSGIWIENTDNFEQASWLTVNMGIWNLFDMHNVLEMELIPLDMERYRIHGRLRYAIIWKRKLHKSKWYVKTDVHGVSLESIRAEEDNGFRVVDFDHFKVYKYDSTHGMLFDAPVSENFDANQMIFGRVIDFENSHLAQPYEGMSANGIGNTVIHACNYVVDGD